MTAPPARRSAVTWHPASKRLRARHSVKVDLIGCGGNGARMLLRLAMLDRALKALGAPGLSVRVYDGDRVSEANLARQPFAEADVGQYKAIALVHRVNLSYGTSYEARPQHFTRETARRIAPDIIIGCVDTRKARAAIDDAFTGYWQEGNSARYWLDLGNGERTGQVLLGTAGHCRVPLPTCASAWPEITDPDQEDAAVPSCSSREALRRQDLFVNDVLCAQAANLLWRLFRDGRIRHHGAFCNLESGDVRPIPVPAPHAEDHADRRKTNSLPTDSHG